MGGNLNDLDQQHVGDNSVNHPPLELEPGGTMALPLTGRGFVVKSLDRSQSGRPRDPGNVFPFFVTLQNLNRDRARKLFVDAAMFFELPHAILCIYHKQYVKGHPFWMK